MLIGVSRSCPRPLIECPLCVDCVLNEIMNAMTSVKKVCQWNKYLSRVVNGCLVNVWMGQRNGHFVSYLDES